MATPGNPQSAKNLVAKIATRNGFLGEKTLATMLPEVRLEVETALLNKDLIIGSSVITLAKNLYTTKARFVFELLQNADDNSYTMARSPPYVAFHTYRDRIVLESNEDGFTDKNLEAICSIGKSSKTGAQGYIGEKGIGFKSVFMVAWKVHIQSGAFSFSFMHKVGDSGMGMISPQWEDEAEELPQSPMTRITLYLHDIGDADILNKARQTIEQQFKELQETILLFMKNLQHIQIFSYDETGTETTSITYKKTRPNPTYAILEKTTVANGISEKELKHFHVTTHEATNLSKNENRTYSKDEERTRAYAKSQIILAFPLSTDMVPIINPQDLFVFLPVRRVGFNFLIQADFVTDASRQDIVKDSSRNIALLDGVAEAFVKAVLQFCTHEHDMLRYQWMKYLPDKKVTNMGPLWVSLVDKISNFLDKTPVLFGTRGLNRYLIRHIYRLTLGLLDKHGQPLFEDDLTEQMISRRYADPDLGILSNYGLQWASYIQINSWLRKDLQRGFQSRMKSSETSKDWHTRVAKLLHVPFKNKWANRITELREMKLLPLQNGTWVSASSGHVYFPRSNGMDVPSDVNLRLISKGISDPDRITLFKYLGVTEASISLVRQEILQRYASGEIQSSLNLSVSKIHLQYLYLTHHLRDNAEPSYPTLTIYDSEESQCRPMVETMYIVNNEPYGPWELLREISTGSNRSNHGGGVPGYPSSFVHEEYFKDEPSTPSAQNLKWVEWFYDYLNVEEEVPLFCPDELSTYGEYIQKHRPEKFVGCLHMQQEDWSPSPILILTLRKTKVLCRGNRQCLLHDTYFPTSDLERRVERFIEPGAFFPWLWLDLETTPDAIPPTWKPLLEKLSFGYPSTDLDFALDILRYSLDASSITISSSSRFRLFELYEHIQAKVREDRDRKKAQEKVQNMFLKKKCIYVPLEDERCGWVFPNQCVWNAPQELISKYALGYLYEPLLRSEGSNSSPIMQFFRDTLKITNCTWQIYVDELKALKASRCEDVDRIRNIYSALDSLRPNIISCKVEIRAAFEDNALIYVPTDDIGAWKIVSQCVWSRAAKLRERVSLNDEYEELEDLFIGFLGVKPVDLAMAIDELKEAGNNQAITKEDLVESLWTVNSLLATEPIWPASQGIETYRIFPIEHPNGAVTLGSTTTQFFIVDREPLRRVFKAKIKTLSFSLKEVAEFRPFIEWARLEEHYLSRNVKEITSFHGGSVQQVLNPERQIRNRAHALLRIATHFKSPRLRNQQDSASFYQILRNAKVYETDGISLGLAVSQDNFEHVEPGEVATLHIDENQGALKIYLPRDPDDQQYVFTRGLSESLFSCMLTEPQTNISEVIDKEGITATRDILLAPRSRIARALEDSGIPTIEIANVDEENPAEQSINPLPIRSIEGRSRAFALSDETESELGRFDTPTSTTLSPQFEMHDANESSEDEDATQLFLQAHSRSRGPPSLSPFIVQPTTTAEIIGSSERQYAALLHKVVEAARSSALPNFGTLPEESANSTHDRSDWGLRSASQIERDCKVGAAGELYVFELLSRLFSSHQSSGFSRNNWKSNVRKYVRPHPEYATMEPWSGFETSDITYTDGEGILTMHLIERGYLAQETWAGKTPHYFIEVKTTTAQLETRFFMSKSQYQRMAANIIDAENRHTIYVIFRVYHLGRDNMGLKIYLDPATLQGEELLFTPETWSVVPNRDS